MIVGIKVNDATYYKAISCARKPVCPQITPDYPQGRTRGGFLFAVDSGMLQYQSSARVGGR
jgi:hypothetical protein